MNTNSHLIQVLLPLYDNEGHRFGAGPFAETRAELAQRFGGLTAYLRAPAQGVWNNGDGESRDDIVIFEVMVETLEPGWWRDYRRTLESRFRQDVIVIRSMSATVL